MSQLGTVYRYLRIDCDHDISGDVLTVSIDGINWSTALTYIAPVNYPLSVIASNTNKPPKDGYTPYWWRVLTGPNNLALATGTNSVYGLLTDNPELVRLVWTITVKDGE